MWVISIACLTLTQLCVQNASLNKFDQQREFETLAQCDRALLQVARNWNPGPNGAWTFNCVRK